jgi:4,5-DOPA dioxygenase extradiol
MLPSLFVPHGAPTFALHPGAAGARLALLAAELPRPRAIVVASAHWDTPTPLVGAAAQPETIHDFWGFPEPLYDLQYPAPGSPDVAADVVDLLRQAGFAAEPAKDRGLDHAIWIPLRLMFADADIPVVPLSIQSRQGPEYHYRLGQALAPLLAQDVLVVGSGNLTHSLRDFQLVKVSGGGTPPYVRDFADWVWQHVEGQDMAALFDYRRQAPEARRAHPTEDHLLPLYVALGAAGANQMATRLHVGVDDLVLAMDAFSFQPRAARQ